MRATDEQLASLRSKLALAFIMKNEGKYAIEMLKSILPAVGFVSCVDTGSTDGSAEFILQFLREKNIACSMNFVEFSRFDEMRNRAIRPIPQDFEWILMLDADEVLLEKDFGELSSLINQNEADAYAIPRFNWIDRIFGSYTQAYPDHQSRLFRNTASQSIRYDGAVHEYLVGFRNRQILSSFGEATPEGAGIHIHHIKLFNKTADELRDREALYATFLRGRQKETRLEYLAKLWGDLEPFSGAEAYAHRVDFQGWASDHEYLRSSLDQIKPRVIVEIGVWKGGSTITMANHLRDSGITGVVICVDTWLGAWDHWLQPQWFSSLAMDAGYPTLFRTFMANITAKNLQDYVIPLPLDSGNAAEVIRRVGIMPDIIHIDAAHDYQSVMNDLRMWWPLLPDGGVLIGDDYDPAGGSWPDVKRAFQDFFQTTDIENLGGKCRIRKVGG